MLNNLPDVNPSAAFLTVCDDLALRHKMSPLIKPIQFHKAVITSGRVVSLIFQLWFRP